MVIKNKKVSKKVGKKVAEKLEKAPKHPIIIKDVELGKQAVEKMIAKIERKTKAIEDIKNKEDFVLSSKKYPVTIARVKTIMIDRLLLEIARLERDIKEIKRQVVVLSKQK